jgi:Holliday junction resolvase RusA-like endonuclease
MTGNQHSFTITTKLPTLNEYILAERTNKFAGAALKKKFTDICSWQSLQLRGKVNKDEIHSVTIDWHLPTKKSDPDNVSFAVKFLLDGLVTASILKNDGANQIHSLTHNFHYGEKYFIEVTLTEV